MRGPAMRNIRSAVGVKIPAIMMITARLEPQARKVVGRRWDQGLVRTNG